MKVVLIFSCKELTKVKNLKGISRIDSKDTHGWLVRHYANGFTFSKLFSDSKYQTPEKSLIKALVYRLKKEDEIYSMLPIKKLHKNNSSGICGVSKIVRKNLSGDEIVYFASTWSDCGGKQKSKSFSTKKYGFKHAFELAVNYRKKMSSI